MEIKFWLYGWIQFFIILQLLMIINNVVVVCCVCMCGHYAIKSNIQNEEILERRRAKTLTSISSQVRRLRPVAEQESVQHTLRMLPIFQPIRWLFIWGSKFYFIWLIDECNQFFSLLRISFNFLAIFFLVPFAFIITRRSKIIQIKNI